MFWAYLFGLILGSIFGFWACWRIVRKAELRAYPYIAYAYDENGHLRQVNKYAQDDLDKGIAEAIQNGYTCIYDIFTQNYLYYGKDFVE